MLPLQDLNIIRYENLITPADIKEELPATKKNMELVSTSREEIKNILNKKDHRMIFVVGPCSIHDPQLAIDYASRLTKLREDLKENIYIIMRVYFEKPRTTIGWKGLINDPHLDGTNDILTGLRLARKILKEILEIALPTATEFLDPIVPQYIADLISWAAIGARTTESQTHREMASGLSMPVGFKNSTEGNFQIAVDATQSAQHPHHFLGIDQDGKISIFMTDGNPYGHIILRGGREQPNYEPTYVREALERLEKAKLKTGLMVDCSHANSNKNFQKQEVVWNSVIEQRVSGNPNLMGMMLESNLYEGNQPLTNAGNLKYGVSITDACVNFDTTRRLLEYAANELARRPTHGSTPKHMTV